MKIAISAELDDLPIRGNAIDTGDLAEDELIARTRQGDVWAWANVTVTGQAVEL